MTKLSRLEWVATGDGWEELRDGDDAIVVVRPVTTSEGPRWMPMVIDAELFFGAEYDSPAEARTAAEQALAGSM